MAHRQVILVPGLFGSKLTGPPAGPLTFTIWLAPPALLLGGFRALRLPVPGEDDGPILGPAVFSGTPLPFYYGFIARYLSRAGWEVFFPQSDWRKPIIEDAQRLAGFIRNKYPPTGPVNFLVHSRGGLVLKEAMKLFGYAELEERGVRVVAMGVPHEGSLNAAAALSCYDPTKLALLRMGSYLPPGVSRHLGLSLVRQVMRSWPSIYELLPDPASTWVKGVNPNVLYNAPVYNKGDLDPVPAYLAAAKLRWATAATIPSWVEWIDVIGDDVPTYEGVPNLADINTRGSMSATDDGDGTVTFASAGGFTSRKRILTPTAHEMLPCDGRLYPYLQSALASGLAENLTLKGKVRLGPSF